MLTKIILIIILIIILTKTAFKNLSFLTKINNKTKRILPKNVEKTKNDFNELLTFEELLEDEEDGE